MKSNSSSDLGHEDLFQANFLISETEPLLYNASRNDFLEKETLITFVGSYKTDKKEIITLYAIPIWYTSCLRHHSTCS